MGVDFNVFEEDVNWYPSQLTGVKISLPIFDGLGGWWQKHNKPV